MSTAKRILESTDPIYTPQQPPKFDMQDVDSEMEFEKRYQRDMENGVEFNHQSDNVAARAIEDDIR